MSETEQEENLGSSSNVNITISQPVEQYRRRNSAPAAGVIGEEGSPQIPHSVTETDLIRQRRISTVSTVLSDDMCVLELAPLEPHSESSEHSVSYSSKSAQEFAKTINKYVARRNVSPQRPRLSAQVFAPLEEQTKRAEEVKGNTELVIQDNNGMLESHTMENIQLGVPRRKAVEVLPNVSTYTAVLDRPLAFEGMIEGDDIYQNRATIDDMLFDEYDILLHKTSDVFRGPSTNPSKTETSPIDSSLNIPADAQTLRERQERVNFGMWDGVVVRCMVQIFGGIMFLRLGEVIGKAGIGIGSLVILLCSAISLMTAMSLSAIASNGIIPGGGMYYMLSRSLGPKFGGAIGLLVAISESLQVALYLQAFAEAFQEHVKSVSKFFSQDDLGTVLLITFILLLLLVALTFRGLIVVVRVQIVFLAVIFVGVLSVFIGAFVSPSFNERRQGFVGVQNNVFKDNFAPQKGLSFISLCSIFFPAVAGITGGTVLFGQLSTPEKDIPYGTFISIGISTSVYLCLGWVIGACSQRAALIQDPLLMTVISFSSALVYCGVYAATLSSALSSLATAPRLFHAVSVDRLFPLMAWLSPNPGANKTLRTLPETTFRGKAGSHLRRSLLLTSLIAFLGLLFAGIENGVNGVSPVITGATLLSYTLINYACFATSLAAAPGWRPSFRYYSKWISLAGFLSCVAFLVLLNTLAAFAALLIGAILYKLLDYRRIDVQWGSAGEAVTIAAATTALKKVLRLRYSPQTYRPNVLVLCGDPWTRPHLCMFANGLSKGNGIMQFGRVRVIPEDPEMPYSSRLRAWRSALTDPEDLSDALKCMRIKGGTTACVCADSLSKGIEKLVETAAMSHRILGGNVVLVGFPESWNLSSHSSSDWQALEYVKILRFVLALDLGLLIVRRPPASGAPSNFLTLYRSRSLKRNQRNRFVNRKEKDVNVAMEFEEDLSLSRSRSISRPLALDALDENGTRIPSSSPARTIDVWWRFDDGGLTLLCAYLWQKTRTYRNCQLRVMTIVESRVGYEAVRMVGLLKRLRIPASIAAIPVELDQAGNYCPSDEIQRKYQTIVAKSRQVPEEQIAISKQARQHLQVADLIHIHSKGASLVIVTVPVPSLSIPADEYMAWLELQSEAPLPPVVMIRGNQSNVLTADL